MSIKDKTRATMSSATTIPAARPTAVPSCPASSPNAPLPGLDAFNRAGTRIDAMRERMQNLERDRAVVLFPEGHRSPDHTMQKGMLGVIYLAMKSQAPILPVAVTGTEKFPLWRVPFPFGRLKANIGPPFTLPIIEGRPSREVMSSLLDMVMGRIADLLPPEYRGVYDRDAVKGPAKKSV